MEAAVECIVKYPEYGLFFVMGSKGIRQHQLYNPVLHGDLSLFHNAVYYAVIILYFQQHAVIVVIQKIIDIVPVRQMVVLMYLHVVACGAKDCLLQLLFQIIDKSLAYGLVVAQVDTHQPPALNAQDLFHRHRGKL